MHTVFIELKTFLYKGTATRSWFWWNSYTNKALAPKGREADSSRQGTCGGRLLLAPASASTKKRVERKRDRWVKSEREKRKERDHFLNIPTGKLGRKGGRKREKKIRKKWYLFLVVLTWNYCPKERDLLTFSTTSSILFCVWPLLVSGRGWSHQLSTQPCWSKSATRQWWSDEGNQEEKQRKMKCWEHWPRAGDCFSPALLGFQHQNRATQTRVCAHTHMCMHRHVHAHAHPFSASLPRASAIPPERPGPSACFVPLCHMPLNPVPLHAGCSNNACLLGPDSAWLPGRSIHTRWQLERKVEKESKPSLLK